MDAGRRQIGWFIVLLVFLSTLRIYPVTVETCGGFTPSGAEQSCSQSRTYHSPFTVVTEGFQYSARDIGMVMTDVSRTYHASPLYLFAILLLAIGAWPLADRISQANIRQRVVSIRSYRRHDRVFAAVFILGLLTVGGIVMRAFSGMQGGITNLSPAVRTLYGISELVSMLLLPFYLVSLGIMVVGSALPGALTIFGQPVSMAPLYHSINTVTAVWQLSGPQLIGVLVFEVICWYVLAALLASAVHRWRS